MLVIGRPQGWTPGREGGAGAPWHPPARKAEKRVPKRATGTAPGGGARGPAGPDGPRPSASRQARGARAEAALGHRAVRTGAAPGALSPGPAASSLTEPSSCDRWSCGRRGRGPAAHPAVLGPRAAQRCPPHPRTSGNQGQLRLAPARADPHTPREPGERRGPARPWMDGRGRGPMGGRESTRGGASSTFLLLVGSSG